MYRRVAAAVVTVVLAFSPAAPASAVQAGGQVAVAAVTTNEQTTPLGIDSPQPRFGWKLTSAQRGQRQTAYRLLVSTRPRLLRPGVADVWDSGRTASAAQVGIRYGGPALRSATRYYWSVRVEDAAGRASRWSTPAWFETGLLAPGDWTGQWIAGRSAAVDPAETSLTGTSWVWYPEATGVDLPAATRYFRTSVELPAKPIRSAYLLATADDRVTAYVNGTYALSGTAWDAAQRADVSAAVRPGRLVLAASATNDSPGPAGLLARLRIAYADGSVSTVDTGSAAWRSATAATDGWEHPDFDDSAWLETRTLASYGAGPWGNRAVVQIPAPPAPLLRTGFTVSGTVARARLYASSPGYGELSVNGRRTDDAVLDPAWTRYDRRVQYVTRDVTRLLKPGANVLGAVLGRGFYGLTTRNVWDHDRAPWHGDPRLRAQLRVEYTDGRLQTVATDGTWRTTDSPTVSDSIYAGETYDARRAIRGWDTAAVSAAGWQPARVVPAPTATVDAQEHEPIRIVRTHRATTIDNPRPGTYVFRFPVTLAGWARLRVTGPAGTQVTLRYGEKLRADGTVNNDNEYVTGDHQVDRYVLRGGAAETWEPRFSYKGFTYVQVDGYPGRPTAASVQARELHTDVPSIGDFTSSNPLLNTIHKMTRQSILNNLHGLPTDTPMYEKNGWLGDALMTNGAASYNFGMQRIYRKWLDDVRDSIFPDGLVPVIAPTGGWGRWNSVEWGAAYPLILWSCYLHYGDRELLAEHYEAVRRYADYLNGKAKPDGTHDSTLGDWVPPGFHGNPPEGAAQSATAFVALVHATVADMARALDRPADVTRYTDLASSTRTALNTRFLDADRGVYSTDRPVGYRQTPNILPPAFGLSPAGAVTDKVIANLVADIHAKGDHLDTGILGTRYLFALLTAHGHGELAYRVATQTTYPSWGYWIGKGATTLWEMWDEGSRSLDHHMFGSIDQWFVEDLAGLRPTEPGYAAVRVAPHPLGDLTSASARVATVRGDVAVSWRKAAGVLSINVTVPVGATATVVLPGVTGWRVDGGYGGVAGAPGVQSVHQEDATQVVTIGSGTYRFRGSA